MADRPTRDADIDAAELDRIEAMLEKHRTDHIIDGEFGTSPRSLRIGFLRLFRLIAALRAKTAECERLFRLVDDGWVDTDVLADAERHGYERCTADVVAWLNAQGPSHFERAQDETVEERYRSFALTRGITVYGCASAIESGEHVGAADGRD